MMKAVVGVFVLALFPAVASAAEFPDWAYPVAPQGLPRPDPNKIVTQPGSDKKYTEVEVNNPFGPPDWYPMDHAPLPKTVAEGRRPGVRACALCHLTTGDGHPESSSIAGLSAAYIVRQLTEFKNGGRKGIRTGAMTEIATAINDEEAKEAGAYFAARKALTGYTKVVEKDVVPKSVVGEGAMRFEAKEGGTEPIGNRIINVPQNEEAARARNPRFGFVNYVPPGSIAKGQALATTGGGGKTLPCAICHGQGLKGLGDVPAIAHRDPIYIYRQLNDMQAGMRNNAGMALMKAVVEKLDSNDMIALSAYVGSLEP
jgi:cytochrome c553